MISWLALRKLQSAWAGRAGLTHKAAAAADASSTARNCVSPTRLRGERMVLMAKTPAYPNRGCRSKPAQPEREHRVVAFSASCCKTIAFWYGLASVPLLLHNPAM